MARRPTNRLMGFSHRSLFTLKTYPRANKGCQELPTTDVDILWTEGHEIVCGGDRVRGDVDTQCDNYQTYGSEGCLEELSERVSVGLRHSLIHLPRLGLQNCPSPSNNPVYFSVVEDENDHEPTYDDVDGVPRI